MTGKSRSQLRQIGRESPSDQKALLWIPQDSSGLILYPLRVPRKSQGVKQQGAARPSYWKGVQSSSCTSTGTGRRGNRFQTLFITLVAPGRGLARNAGCSAHFLESGTLTCVAVQIQGAVYLASSIVILGVLLNYVARMKRKREINVN